jgi:hypothetical protein
MALEVQPMRHIGALRHHPVEKHEQDRQIDREPQLANANAYVRNNNSQYTAGEMPGIG